LIAAAKGAYNKAKYSQTFGTNQTDTRRCIMLYNETASPQNKSSENTHINQFAAAAAAVLSES
jgi:hypothetical protein